MKNKKLFLLVFLVLIFVLWISKGFTLEKKTHEYLNQQIAQRTIDTFSLDSYLKNNLGFEKGAQESISGYSEVKKTEIKQEVWRWMGEGGIKEDEPEQKWRQILGIARNINHFHNPLGGLWKDSGLDDTYVFHYTGQSSIIWAQNPNQDPGGKWSWYQARDYFYKGLTIADKTEREKAMANCFRALGQLMHLVHDASVPAHSRNQIHIGFQYEKWVEKIRTGNPSEQALFGQFIANPKSFDPSILNLVVSDQSILELDPSPPIPIANIIDTNTYSGSNPDPGVTAGTTIGIAEYTNANFFSERTIFKNFPYPNKNTSVDVEDRQIPDPRGVKPPVMRPYYIKKHDGEGAPSSESLAEGKKGYRLATVGFLKDYITKNFPRYLGSLNTAPALDGGVYNDYAEKLLPRAVGYSAGLLEYFFRGKIEITDPIIDQGNTRITLKAKNTTANDEEMTGGDNASIMLVVKYKVPSGQDYFYIVTPEKNGIKSIPRTEPPTEPPTKPIELTFDLSLSPLPIDATDIYFQVVYKGKLGKGEGINWVGEENAVCVGFVGLKITAVLLVSTVFGRQNLMLQSYQVNEGTGKISPVISSLIIDGRTPAHPLLVGKSVLLSAYYNSNFPFLETRPISAKSIGAEIDLKQISDEAESYGSMAMIDFTDNIKVIARQNTIGGVNIQTREISSAGAISTDFISSKYGAQGLELFLHGKNVLVFLGGVSLEQIIAQTLAISDDGTLGEDWIDQSLPSGDYPSPGFTATRVSDSTFAIIARYHDEVNPTIPKGYLFTYNISAEGIITPDYVDAREISSDTEIYGYTIFQVHPGIFAITYYIDPYGDYKLETWKIDDDGTIGASPIDTLVLGLWGSYITDFIKISGDIFAFSFADEIDPGSPHDVQERIIPDEDRTFAASLGDWTGDAVLWSIPDAFNVALFNFTPTKNSAKETLSYPNVLIEANGTATFQIYFSTGGPNPPPDSVTLTLTVSDGNYSFVGAPGNPYYFFGWPVRFYVDTPLDWNRENAYVEIKVDVITSPSEYNPSGDSSVWFFAPSVTESWTYVGTPPSTYVKTIRILPTGVIERILDSVQLTVDTPVPVYLNYRKSGG